MKMVPNVADGREKFDFVVVTTKNVPDVPPTVVDIIAPAVTPGHSAILLLQNGLNIERPLIKRFPKNVILSGVSMIGATEYEKGKVRHDGEDILKLGAFNSPQVPTETAQKAAKDFVDMYSAGGKVVCDYDDNVLATRWRKLIYNSCYNSIATILRMDTSRMRIYEHVIEDLVRPAMMEIRSIAAADGVDIPEDYLDYIIKVDPLPTFFKPSMQQDIEKGNFIEYENIVGEPLREAQRLGVATPVLKVVYGLLKALQVKVMEERGLVEPKMTEHSKYRQT